MSHPWSNTQLISTEDINALSPSSHVRSVIVFVPLVAISCQYVKAAKRRHYIFDLSRAMIRNFQVIDYTSGLPGSILFLVLLSQTSTCRNSHTSLVSGEISSFLFTSLASGKIRFLYLFRAGRDALFLVLVSQKARHNDRHIS
jgi:hypothetical protein